MNCNKYSTRDYADYLENPDSFICINCTGTIFPFSNINDTQLKLSMLSNSVSAEELDLCFTPTEFQMDIFNRLNQLMNTDTIDSEDDDDDRANILPMINCKYYSIDQFVAQSYNEKNHFSIMHLNIHSLQKHIEELKAILSMLSFVFDVVCITESKLIKNIPPICDLTIPGYEEHIT